MLKVENVDTIGWEPAIRGMRNPMNSWANSDSGVCETHGSGKCKDCEYINYCHNSDVEVGTNYILGSNDLKLMTSLRDAGTDHRKFMRMIAVYMDITAPLYWWKEFDTYKVGTVANSCSTMHKIADKEFTQEDFSCEHLDTYREHTMYCPTEYRFSSMDILSLLIDTLNQCRKRYLETKAKSYWWQMIQLLPSSYNQRRTVMLNYEVLANMYKSRKDHKLDEWHTFCDEIRTLPYSELITGKEKD